MSSPSADCTPHLLVWMAFSLFLSYLAVAMSLPVVSLHVTRHLGFGNALGGLAVGLPFLSTLLTRGRAGALSDLRGAKTCMLRGLAWYAVASVACMVSAWPAMPHAGGIALLMAGRLLLGLGESLALVGLISWAIGLAGPARSGRVLALVGMAMYGAFAAGGPVGLALYDALGFAGTMGVCAALPLLGMAMMLPLPAVPPQRGTREPFVRVVGRVWRQGAVVCLQGVGFAALGAFVPLLFLARDWPHAGLGLTCFGVGFVLVRLLFGHLPDRVGGLPVALVSLAVEACGQCLLWLAPGPVPALAGALLTGLGCSMVFPAMGVEVVRRVPAHLRGTAVGGFAAFQDIAYGFTGPLAGLVADRFGHASVFLLGGMAAVLGLAMVAVMSRGEAVAAAS